MAECRFRPRVGVPSRKRYRDLTQLLDDSLIFVSIYFFLVLVLVSQTLFFFRFHFVSGFHEFLVFSFRFRVFFRQF